MPTPRATLDWFGCATFRLRVGELRVFYDVTQTTVQILAIVAKAVADRWLAEEGAPEA